MKNRADDPELAEVRKELEAELERLASEYGVPDDRGSVPRDPHARIQALKKPQEPKSD